jgi:hypothetical protein
LAAENPSHEIPLAGCGFTPATSKAKLRAAVPSKGVVTIYQTANDFNAVVRAKTELGWIQHELRSLPTDSSQTMALIRKR